MGLGNPGPEYEDTRHNVGFMVAKLLCERTGARPAERNRTYASWQAADLAIRTPLTYMNSSGDAVAGLDANDLLDVVDDVYLPLGTVRIRAGGGDGGHNGLTSIEMSLGTDQYARLRVGVGRGEEELRDHVLSGFAPEEREVLNAALDAACEASLVWAKEGVIQAMNRFNTRR